MAKSTQHAPRAARSSKPAADVVDAPEGTVRVYPTHRRDAGPLVVAVPVDGSHTDELVIDDEGADVPTELADQLIAAREATTDAPDEE